MNLRRLFFKLAQPITIFLDSIHFRIGKPKVYGHEIFWLKYMLRPGDILLRRNNFRPSNLFIPGHYTHAGMYYGGIRMEVVEAVIPMVTESTIFDFLMQADSYAILRPKTVPENVMTKVTLTMRSLCGRMYDFFFSPNDKEFYCSEAILFAYGRHTDALCDVKSSRIMGRVTYTPQDLYDSKEHFEIVYEKRG